jgi:hypothetical protein
MSSSNSVGSGSSAVFGLVRLPSLFFLLPQPYSFLSSHQCQKKKNTATAVHTAFVLKDVSEAGEPLIPKFRVVEVFAFLAGTFLLAYCVVLLIFAIIAVINGQIRIWFSSVTDADFSAVEVRVRE